MIVGDAEIDRLAIALIEAHGDGAARFATERLNEMIDRNNIPGRDLWACIVHRIHERQGSGPAWSGGFKGAGLQRPPGCC